MKTNNYIVLGISALAAAFLLFLWYYLGFNHIDDPFDLVLAILWWVGIVVIAAVIIKLESKRREAIRTVYVSPTALFNSERGVVGLSGQQATDVIQELISNLDYGFSKKDLPEKAKFDYRFVVETSEFKKGDSEKQEDSTWKGTVTKIDRQNGNTELSFEDADELRAALAA